MNPYKGIVMQPNFGKMTVQTQKRVRMAMKCDKSIREYLNNYPSRSNKEAQHDPITFEPLRFAEGWDGEQVEKARWSLIGDKMCREFKTMTYPGSMRGKSCGHIQFWESKASIKKLWRWCEHEWVKVWKSPQLENVKRNLDVHHRIIYLKKECEWGRYLWKFEDGGQMTIIARGATWIINMDQHPNYFPKDGTCEYIQVASLMECEGIETCNFEYANVILASSALAYKFQRFPAQVLDRNISMKMTTPHNQLEQVWIQLENKDKIEIEDKFNGLDKEVDEIDNLHHTLQRLKEAKIIPSLDKDFDAIQKKVMDNFEEKKESLDQMQDGSLHVSMVDQFVLPVCESGKRPYGNEDIEARSCFFAFVGKYDGERVITKADENIYAAFQIEVSMGKTSSTLLKDHLYPGPFVTWKKNGELKVLSQSEPHKHWEGESEAMEFMTADPYKNRIIPANKYHLGLINKIEHKLEHVENWALPYDINWGEGKMILRNIFAVSKVSVLWNCSYHQVGEELAQKHGAFDWNHGSFVTELAEIPKNKWEDYFDEKETADRHIEEERLYINSSLVRIKLLSQGVIEGSILHDQVKIVLDMNLSEVRIHEATGHLVDRPLKLNLGGRGRARDRERRNERDRDGAMRRSRSRSRERNRCEHKEEEFDFDIETEIERKIKLYFYKDKRDIITIE